MQEKVIEIKQCKHCDTSYEITDKDLEFYTKISPVFQTPPNLPLSGEGQKDMGNGKVKYLIPAPNECPDCRQQRRLSFRNERHLYKRNCDANGKQIISIYSPDKPYKVYNQEFWWSDKWDALDYGKDFDFSRGFFEQFEELFKCVPLFSLFVTNSQNCDYNNALVGSKNCYLCSGSFNENCLYSQYINNTDNCVDGYMLINCSNCYQSIDCEGCYNCLYTKNCFNCNNCISCANCKSCENCIGCTNLVNKKYCINNIQYSKEYYINEVNNLNNLIFKNADFVPFSYIEQSENIVGNYVTHSKNCYNVFDVSFSENLKNCSWFHNSINCHDCYSWGKKAELCYECAGVGGGMAYNNISCFWVQNSTNILYTAYSFDCSNLFGCVGLKNKSYCIFNKQYTKVEYEILVPKIIDHMMKTCEWGEFFPSNISPFGYNETVAMEYFPISNDKTGLYKWSDYESPHPNVEKVIKANQLPQSITEIPDDILNWAIECEVTKKPFRIVKAELEFYRKHNLPIPTRHPDQRHLDRMSLRNPRKLYDRKCDKCGIDMKTTYGPECTEKVYCEKCYEKEVY